MFDFFRNNIKLLMGLLMLLIIPSFVLFGVEGYSKFRETRDVVARVGKTEITRQEWDAAHRTEVDRLAASLPGVDRASLDTEASRLLTLERLVDERALALAAQDNRLLTTDERLARELMQDPTIAGLRQANGQLDVERYRRLLQSQGQTPESFEASVRADLARRQVAQGVAGSGFVPDKVAKLALDAYFERREVQLARFVPASYRAQVKVGDADVSRYYEEHRNDFQTIEQLDAEYVVLDLDAVARGIRLSESDLRAYHEQNSAAQTQKEQRRARHILLTLEATAGAERKAQVKAEAEQILAQLRQDRSRFAELARTRSQDPGSASQGGDLGYFDRGSMVKPFEDVVYALGKGELSGVVETEFGFHVIELTDIRRPAAEPFELARPRLEAELMRQQAQRRFAELAEEFSNLVYEQSDSLAPAAEKFGLTVKQVKGLTRGGAGPDAPAWLSQSKVLETVFQPEAVRLKRNSHALEVGASQLVSVRVLEHRPSVVQALEQVAPQVRERLLQQRAAELARQDGQAKLTAWQAQPSSAALGEAALVSRVEPRGLPADVLRATMSTVASGQTPGWAGVDLGPEGYVVLRVNRVLPREEPTSERARQERDQVVQLWVRAEAQAYLKALRAHYKAEVLPVAKVKEAVQQ